MHNKKTRSSKHKKCIGGGMEIEFYAPPFCTKACTLREDTPSSASLTERFVSKGIIENMIFMWSERQLFSIDMTMQELLMGPSYLRMRKSTRKQLPYPAYTKVTTRQLQLALRVVCSCADILSKTTNSSPTADEVKCAQRWLLWKTCLNNVLNIMKKKKWIFVCVGFV